jgi:glycosyltransferase involved in cell wall biosynthesis
MVPRYLNGKFLAQRTTGVQRVAMQLMQALDALAQGRWVLLCPPAAVVPALRHIEVRRVGRAAWPLHAWEQGVLPHAAADGLLVNLSGSAPAFVRRQVCMLHDAAVFDRPQAYTLPFVAWYRWLFRRLARRAEGLLTVSVFSRDRLAEHLRIPPDRLRVLPNGADHLDAVISDPSILDRFELGDKRFLLAVGSANTSKNLSLLTEAFVRLPSDPTLRLVIVGAAHRRVFAEATVAEAPGVVRVGPVADAQLKALYGRATALVFPSLYEGFGLPPLEAMACGCPVVAARAASIPEVCGGAALYFDPSSVDGLATVLRQIVGDEALRRRLREAGAERARSYRWSDAAAKLLAALPAQT